jgi:uncharacterized protein
MHYLLFYDYSDDYLTRRQALRPAHFEYARSFIERGELILGGALAEPVDTGVLLFKADSAEIAEQFAVSDPYVKNGLVKSWRVRPWTTVVGPEAATPLMPAVPARQS